MFRRNVQSSEKPRSLTEGATTILITSDAREVRDEEDGTHWEYEEISMSLDEASNVKNHILPYGEKWTDGLRSYERRAMYDEADRFKTKAI